MRRDAVQSQAWRFRETDRGCNGGRGDARYTKAVGEVRNVRDGIPEGLVVRIVLWRLVGTPADSHAGGRFAVVPLTQFLLLVALLLARLALPPDPLDGGRGVRDLGDGIAHVDISHATVRAGVVDGEIPRRATLELDSVRAVLIRPQRVDPGSNYPSEEDAPGNAEPVAEGLLKTGGRIRPGAFPRLTVARLLVE